MSHREEIFRNIEEIKEKISSARDRSNNQNNIILVAVTKTRPHSILETVLDLGLNHIGENRVQEAENKFAKLNDNVSIVKRMIGHLQSNKAKKAVEIFDTIDSVDSLKLAKRINHHGGRLNKNIDVLLEINTSNEKQKHGFEPVVSDELFECIQLDNICVSGLMTVGPLTREEWLIRKSFKKLVKIQDELNRQLPAQKLETLSMGMSGDYEIAIEEGSNMLRLGTALFGKRSG